MAEDLTNYLRNIIGQTAGGIGITLVERDVRRLFGALNRLGSRTRYHSNNIPRLAAIDYKHMLMQAIIEGNGLPGYAEYHPGYKSWKDKNYPGKGYWQLAGDLVAAIKYQRVPIASGAYAWFTGVPAGVKDSGGKSWFTDLTQGKTYGRAKEIAWYGRIMEKGYFGKQNHPPRPIFGPVFVNYKSSNAFHSKGTEALMDLKRHWHSA